MKKSRFEIPYALLRGIAWTILKAGFAFEVRGINHLAACRQGLILAGNHTGLLDSLTIYAACQRYFRFMMTEEVFTWGLIGKLVPYGNIISLYQGRERKALMETIQLLRQGSMVCIFPEGKLTQDGHLNRFNEGVAFLQQKSGAPILPFAIHGGFEAWAHTSRLPHFRKVILEFGPPIEAGQYNTRTEIVQALEIRVRQMKTALDESQGMKPVINLNQNAYQADV
ncbi:MAG: acyl-[ACP]--phospholipid O-acyltransferase [Vampirovibrio sp.]|jgi:1-acyl-sn-glycerol-3-phosphate acyltransferase|nr:acyl-[ACP]--phospholipid O-acyltransferase [Vampirovibrio sp.]